MKLEPLLSVDLPLDKQISKIRSVSFHPTQNKIAIGFRKEIFEYDLGTGSRTAHFKTESEVTHIEHSHTHPVLVASLQNGCFSVLDLNTNTLTAFHIPVRREEARSASFFALSHKRPMIFYSRSPSKLARERSNVVFGIEMFSDSKHRVEYSHKKQITAITTHPSKSMMASASSDGIIKIWETEQHNLLFQIEEYEANKKEKEAVTSLCFCNNESNDYDILISGTREGSIKVWSIPTVPNQAPRVLGYATTDEWITSLLVHPSVPCLFYLNGKGCLNSIDIGSIIYSTTGGPKMKTLLTDFEMLDPYYVALHRTKDTKKRLIPIINATCHPKTGAIAFYGKNFQISELNARVIKGTIVADRFPIFSTFDSVNPGSMLPHTSIINCNLETLLSPKKQQFNSHNELVSSGDSLDYLIPFSSIPYIDGRSRPPHSTLLSYDLKKEKAQVLIGSLRATQDLYPYYRCTKTNFSANRKSVIIFYEKLLNSSNTYESDNSKFFFSKVDDIYSSPKDKVVLQLQKGIDGGFLGDSNKDYVVLSEGGDVLKVYYNNELQSDIKLKGKVKYLSTSPFDRSVIYCTAGNELSMAVSIEDKTEKRLQTDLNRLFHLRDNEALIDIQWQNETMCNEPCLIGVLTSRRVLILNKNMDMLSCVEAPSQLSFQFQSILWIGSVLLYNSKNFIHCLHPYGSTNNASAFIGTLDHADSVMCAVLCDRVFFVSHKDRIPSISYRYLNIVEPLMLGILSIPKDVLSPDQKGELLRKVTERFDCRNVSEKTLINLEKQGYPQLASELVTNSLFNFSWELRLRLAKGSMNFSYALQVLVSQYEEESHDRSGFISKHSKFYSHFVDLAKTSLEYGQFSVAHKCFDMINDVWSLFNLFTTTNNANGLKLLALRCKDSPDFYSIYTACTLLIGHEAIDDFMRSYDLSAHDSVKVDDWPIKVSDMKEFEVSTEIKGRMLVSERKLQAETPRDSSLTSPPSMTNVPSDDEIVKMDMTDFLKWLGYGTMSIGKENLEEVGFKDDFGGNQSVSSIEEDLPTEPSKSSSKLPPLQHKLPPPPSLDVPSTTTTTESSEKDEDESSEMSSTKDAKKNRKSENSDSDDSSSGEEDDYDKKTKAFQGLKIKEEVIYKDASATDIRHSVSGLAGLGGIGASRNRRRRGGAAKEEKDNTPSEVQETSPATPKSVSSSSSQQEDDRSMLVNVNPTQCLKDGMTAMEKGDFKEARNQMISAISALVKDNTQILKKSNILLCVHYKLLIHLLARIRAIEAQNDIQELARLATFICQINVINKHKIVCYNMGIKRNLNAGNYGITSHILKHFLPLSEGIPKLKEELLKRQQECSEKSFVDADLELANHYSGVTDDEPLKFCWKTYKLINSNFLKCSYCSALIASVDSVNTDDTCPYCTYGNLELQEFK
ncbi:hypothetical protein C9374_011361 [Naegleria lovaniensis]|uniref:Guanine nucleotide-binding protein subunit beta-like protein n=1 Tax=Naegleria lovaniensis TaxID=51637 RepID=A0AA88H4D2_NAELO|nr:uncharacterized protein C9374_011361 [Naegleria lovaniensis]KAG2392636.1 hypothetical protein C9374_011361 [Naegleria lovaniensis]